MIHENSSLHHNNMITTTTGVFVMQDIPQNLRIEEFSQNLQQHDGELVSMGLQQRVIHQQQQHFVDERSNAIFFNNNQHDNVNTVTNPAQLICENNIFVAYDYNSNSNHNTTEPVPMGEMIEINNTSDASNVESNAAEAEILPSEDQFPYLQGLNSGDLMKFSQESAINDLLLKQQYRAEDVKPNLDILPTFEEHDIGGYKFQLNISSKTKGKASSFYSTKLNKVFLRMNEICTIDAIYTPKMPPQNLRIRVLMCFIKEVSEPVLRCQNHISKDTEPHPKKRHSLLRCENPSAEYCGTAEGKSINDRLGVLIPLSAGINARDDNSIALPIALKFTCQNSCIGRKETSLVFILESMNGEILSQRVLDVKVCSCPKRDQEAEERQFEAKRKMNEDIFPYETTTKVPKTANTKVAATAHIKRERDIVNSDTEEMDNDYDDGDNDDGSDDSPKKFDIQRTPSGGFRIVMELTSRDAALFTIETAVNKMAGKVLSGNARHSVSYKKNHKRLKRLYDKAVRL